MSRWTLTEIVDEQSASSDVRRIDDYRVSDINLQTRHVYIRGRTCLIFGRPTRVIHVSLKSKWSCKMLFVSSSRIVSQDIIYIFYIILHRSSTQLSSLHNDFQLWLKTLLERGILDSFRGIRRFDEARQINVQIWSNIVIVNYSERFLVILLKSISRQNLSLLRYEARHDLTCDPSRSGERWLHTKSVNEQNDDANY